LPSSDETPGEVRVTNTDDPLYNRLMIDIMGEESAALCEYSAALRKDAHEQVAASRRLRARSRAMGEGRRGRDAQDLRSSFSRRSVCSL
jgi:hypothetical protein